MVCCSDAASEISCDVLRSALDPATVGRLAGAEVAVTGLTAGSKDFIDAMTSHAPLVFVFVLSLAFILLLVTFRSIVVPIKAIVLNLLSVGEIGRASCRERVVVWRGAGLCMR